MFWKKSGYAWLLLGIVIVANISLDLHYYSDYQEKLNILEQMLQAENDAARMDAVSGLLKYNFEAKKPAYRPLLEQYGYTQGVRDRYYDEFVKSCAVTAACSTGLLLIAWTVAAAGKKRIHGMLDGYFWGLFQCLAQFRNGRVLEETDRRQFPLLDGYENATMRVNEQLELLLEHLELACGQAYKDREEVKRLVTDISHQLKTPVAALDTCFDVLNSGFMQDASNGQQGGALTYAQQREFMQRCKSELEGMKTLLESLLQVSRLEIGMIRIEQVRAPILDTVIQAVNRVYPKASGKQIEFYFDYDSQMEKLEIMQDSKWLCEAFVNILDNSIKYSPCGSEIGIRLQQYAAFVRVEVEDAGIGIPKRERHKVFRRFYRGEDARVKKEDGSGVGLYLTRQIIERHQGTVSVKDRVAQGTGKQGCRLVVQLPYVMGVSKGDAG